jgi:uncharacterized protein (DUF1501 family)
MNRRKFLNHTIPAVTLPALLNGFSFKAFGNAPQNGLLNLLSGATATDNVLVIIQMYGGNDGLNMVIPIDMYANYYNARANVAIPQSKVLRLDGTDKTGFHPVMTGLQNMFNDGKVSVVQSVGYANPDFSHFRATDIWMSGDSTTDRFKRVKTGWMGRYLGEEYPGYPDAYPSAAMPDPLAVQISDYPTLTVQGNPFSMGLAITDPLNVYNFVNPFNDYPLSSTPANKELRYLRVVADKTKIYSDKIRTAYLNANTLATYPADNYLGEQLKIVARLIKGGLKTRVYTVSMGGFDTHKKQVNASDTTTGMHAQLLKNLSTALVAFQSDIKQMNLEDRVLGMTVSEFGRRIKSNASLGTDHGSAAPLLLFGKHVSKGVLGNSPDIPADINVVNNIPFQYDFRSVYASVLERWFCVKQPQLDRLLLKNYQSLPIIKGGPCGLPDDIAVVNNQSQELLLKLWPNPYSISATLQFTTKGGPTSIQQFDAEGRLVKTITDKTYPAGKYNIDIYKDGLPTGIYFLRMQNNSLQKMISVMKVKE